jgi:hypothetical protein
LWIAVKTNSVVKAHLNDFINPVIGIDNIDGGSVDATMNWGAVRGDRRQRDARMSVARTFLFLPFLTKPF